jgi:uncharacterized protein (TIGR03083 family)
VDGWGLVIAERQSLIDLFRTLDPDDWQRPSLCPGWTAHHVLAHLTSVLEAGPMDMARAAVLGLGLPPRITAVLARTWVEQPPERLIDGLQEHVDSHFAPPGLGYRASLADVMVHRLDVAVPLGREVHRPAESWRPVLDFLTSRIPMMGSIRGGRPKIAWRTTDLDWSAGSGPDVHGPADAVGVTLAGRDALVSRLEGPGVDLVRAWLTDS